MLRNAPSVMCKVHAETATGEKKFAEFRCLLMTSVLTFGFSEP